MGTWSKRIFFFIFTNIVIVLTLGAVASFVMPFFGITPDGMTGYFIFYSIIGMGGAFISLWMSKWMAIRFMGVQVLDNNSANPMQRELIQKVHHLAKRAGLPAPPTVGIFESAEVNAFATGPSKKNSLVAVSTGLLSRMNEQETEGVLAHEVAHIANGDMVTMSLIQGVVNVMVYLIAHILAQVVSNALFKDRRNWFVEYMIRQAFAMLLFIPGSMVVCFFSRWREYRADHGGGRLAGKDKMISALTALQQISLNTQAPDPAHSKQEKQYSYLMINNRSRKSLVTQLFSTHPPLEDRINRLKGRAI